MATETIPQPGKAEIRRRTLAAREKLGVADRDRAVARIFATVRSLPRYQAARTVAAYMSFGTELSTTPFLDSLDAEGKSLVLPRVDAARRQLVLHRVDSRAVLVAGKWGILEPSPDLPPAALSEIDFMLVPGVAFDREGNRIGYGAGFYDRLLAGRAPRTEFVAAAFDCQVVPAIPVTPSDQRIDRLVTETLNDEFHP